MFKNKFAFILLLMVGRNKWCELVCLMVHDNTTDEVRDNIYSYECHNIKLFYFFYCSYFFLIILMFKVLQTGIDISLSQVGHIKSTCTEDN